MTIDTGGLGVLLFAVVLIALVAALACGPLVLAAWAAFTGNVTGALVLVIIQFVCWWLLG